ncbi:hypothetical protein [Heyndrickxia acidicola]|uniref:Uncharacterized protein n=1 Tax=Heyndrickxia acidicola TaxID=209389 RepID=A0ABU6MBQ4_9BACI|nr:hypothetical protein [Heyndrickxia acidicola]MED1202107.1 hypothetical protein [Heyndrickxia acidicola]
MTSSRWHLELDITKSGKCLLIGDKHKSRRLRGSLFNFSDGLAYDLEPMALGAGHSEKRKVPAYRRQA